MRFTASSTARLGDTATLVATRRGLVCWSNARPRGRRKRAATRPQAFFDAGTASAPGNNNDSGNNGGGDEPPQQRRSLQSLIELLLSVPTRLDRYYSPPSRIVYAFRRTMWCVISAGAGFYAGNIVTLSFGALAINDVFAAVTTLLFYEVVTRLFYSEGSLSSKSLKMWFVNYFKMGVVLSCLADAIKLGS